MESYQKIWLLLYVINMLSTFGIGVWLYLERRNDKTNERIVELAAKVEKLDKDVSSLGVAAETAPNHADMGEVYKSINELAKTVNQLVGENQGQSDTLRLILGQIMRKGLQ